MVLAQQPWEIFRKQALEPYQEKWRALRDTTPLSPLCGSLMFCDEDGDRARELGKRFVKEYYFTIVEHYEIVGEHFSQTKGYEHYASAAEAISSMGLDAMADLYASVNLYGTPDEIVAKLGALRALGAEYVLINSAGGIAALRRFATEVMPAFR
jgi:alkanesulfonate monooxygenase SsuD/methylene tetrahydromethanopterin reductase-like flavin-dependent oxidoreductase (luciferase family)